MKYLLPILLLFIVSKNTSGQIKYSNIFPKDTKEIKSSRIIGWTIMGFSGTVWGAREAYHADPYIFEKKFNVKSTSFFGSDAWKRNYIDNDPNKDLKKPEFLNVFRDFHHASGKIVRMGIMHYSFNLGKNSVNNKSIKSVIIDSIVGSILFTVGANISYRLLRS